MSMLRLGCLLAACLFSTRAVAQTCESYGIDFKNEGSYFQNISSSDPFTFVSLFEGCGNDVANNILVDTNGEEYQCTDTPLQPDDTSQMSTCPLNKDQLWTGDWSVLIISNNGNADPIAFERDFYLDVGIPATTTITPIVTVTSTSIPLVLITQTSTITVTSTLPQVYSTVASVTKSPTVTITPPKVTTTTTRTYTLKKTAYSVRVAAVITKFKTATCSIPPVQTTPDPWCRITPTLVKAAALSTDSASSPSSAASTSKTAAGAVVVRRRTYDRVVPLNRDQRIAERKARREERNKIQKRAPDVATTTLTEGNTSLYPTSTTVSTGPATTITTVSMSTTTSTLTLPVITVKSGKTTLPVVTITRKTTTTTKSVMTILTTTVKTIVASTTISITSTSTPWAAAVACTAKGGHMK